MRMLLVVLFFCVGIFAQEEIGVPYIPKGISQIDSAVLAPDGKSFYTLKDELVTQWQLSPLEKLLSFKTEIVYQNRPVGYQINVSNDNQRIILYSLEELQLWDIKSKKHLKTIKENISLGTSSKYGFLILTGDNQLQIWSDKDLTLLKTIKIKHDYEYIGNSYPYNMINGDNILFINYLEDGLFFDLDTLKVVDKITHVTDEDNKIRRLHSHEISKYKQVYMDKYSEKFNFYIWRTYMRFIWYQRYFSTLSSYISPIKKDEITLCKLSDKSQYIFTKLFLNEKRNPKREMYYFYQFDDAWILINGRHKFFTGSENIKKYLKMKIKSEEIVPMNDTTFKKYNRQIKLKD